jgi:AGZA family xanthine/uracil permease-like MFS transporter
MRREILAGFSTFFTIAYLLFLYPKILGEGGIHFGAALTATILALVIGTLFLALYASFPVVLAPGLSVGPFLVYSAILKEHASWQTVLGIVFWSGLILLLLSIFKVRQKILFYLPAAIKSAAICGIGLFLICVGLQNLGLFRGEWFHIPQAIALFGLLLFWLLHRFQVKSAFLWTILACWLISVPFGYVPWNGLFALPSSLHQTFFQLDLTTALEPEWFGTLLTVTLISLFDTSASLTALAKLAGKIDERGRIQNIDRIVIPDGVGSMVAALLGTGTLAFTLESASGIKAGGRTGVTAITAALCCLAGLFLVPLLSSIPLFATTPVLIAIGFFMTQEIKAIRWRNYEESIPALLTLGAIPLTFSVYQGFAYGFVSYAFLKAIRGKWKEVHPVCWGLALIFAAHLLWTLMA